MTGLVILIPIALFMGLGGLAAFIWAVRAGQFDDPEGSAVRILISPDEPLNERQTATEVPPARLPG